MPFALITIGMLFIVTGFQDTYKQFFEEVEGDFTGPGNFFYWLISLGILGSLGYVPELRTFSRLSMGLVIIAMFLADKGGVFQKFNTALSEGTTTPVDNPGDPLPSDGGGSSGSSTSGGGSGILGDIGTAATIASFF